MKIAWRENSLFASLADAIKIKLAGDLSRLLVKVPGEMIVTCYCKVPGSSHKKGLHVGVYDEALNVLKVTYQLWGNESRFEFHLRPPDMVTAKGLRAVLLRAIKEERALEPKKPKERDPLPDMPRPVTPAPNLQSLRANLAGGAKVPAQQVTERVEKVVEKAHTVVIEVDHVRSVMIYLCTIAKGHSQHVVCRKTAEHVASMYFNGNEEAGFYFVKFLCAMGILRKWSNGFAVPNDQFALYG